MTESILKLRAQSVGFVKSVSLDGTEYKFSEPLKVSGKYPLYLRVIRDGAGVVTQIELTEPDYDAIKRDAREWRIVENRPPHTKKAGKTKAQRKLSQRREAQFESAMLCSAPHDRTIHARLMPYRQRP